MNPEENEVLAWLDALNSERQGTLGLPKIERGTLSVVAGKKAPVPAQELVAWLKSELAFIRGLRRA